MCWHDMSTVIYGATGYTGRAVVDELGRRSIETVAHVRPDSSKLDAWRKKFEAAGAVVDTTAWDLGELARTFERVDPTVVFEADVTKHADFSWYHR